jgi:MFS family permease
MGRRETAKVLFATMVGTMDTTALLPVIAFYSAVVGADVFTTGIIVGLYSAVHAPANFLFGRLVDRIGRRLPLSAGLLWDAASLLLYALAASPLFLALARVSHGIGGGLVGPSSMSLVADSAPRDRKGRAMALYGISVALSVILGFAIAGAVVRTTAGAMVREDFLPLFYVLAIALGLGAAVAAAIREPRIERRPPSLDPRSLGRFLRRPEPAAGYASIFSLYLILGAFVTLVPLHLEEELGYGTREVALAFTVFAVLSLLLHYPAGMLADRRGPATSALLGLVAIAAAMAVLPLVTDVPSIALTMALFGVGHGFVFPSASALVARSSDPGNLGIATGLFFSILVAGVAIGAPAMAAVAAGSTFGTGLWASSWFALIGIGFLARVVLRPSSDGAALESRTDDDEPRA